MVSFDAYAALLSSELPVCNNSISLSRRPYTEETLIELGASGVKNLVVVPVSFVSEHIETLVRQTVLTSCPATNLSLSLSLHTDMNLSLSRTVTSRRVQVAAQSSIARKSHHTHYT